MQKYSLRRSWVDPCFLEVVFDDAVIEEIKVPFAISSFPLFSTKEEIFSWLAQIEIKLVKQAAYRMLSKRSYSRMSLLRKLKEKQFSLLQIEKVLEELEQLGYLSDAEYAEMVIRQKMRQGYGPLHIEEALRAQGLDASLVRKRMDRSAQKAAMQKWMEKLQGKGRAKTIAFLLRRGFDYSEIPCR